MAAKSFVTTITKEQETREEEHAGAPQLCCQGDLASWKGIKVITTTRPCRCRTCNKKYRIGTGNCEWYHRRAAERARTLIFLNEILLNFLQFLQANAEMVSSSVTALALHSKSLPNQPSYHWTLYILIKVLISSLNN
jgi:hypothetical protein